MQLVLYNRCLYISIHPGSLLNRKVPAMETGIKKTPLQATGTFLFSNGDPPGIRTRDTLIKSQVLYQLS